MSADWETFKLLIRLQGVYRAASRLDTACNRLQREVLPDLGCVDAYGNGPPPDAYLYDNVQPETAKSVQVASRTLLDEISEDLLADVAATADDEDGFAIEVDPRDHKSSEWRVVQRSLLRVRKEVGALISAYALERGTGYYRSTYERCTFHDGWHETTFGEFVRELILDRLHNSERMQELVVRLEIDELTQEEVEQRVKVSRCPPPASEMPEPQAPAATEAAGTKPLGSMTLPETEEWVIKLYRDVGDQFLLLGYRTWDKMITEKTGRKCTNSRNTDLFLRKDNIIAMKELERRKPRAVSNSQDVLERCIAEHDADFEPSPLTKKCEVVRTDKRV